MNYGQPLILPDILLIKTIQEVETTHCLVVIYYGETEYMTMYRSLYLFVCLFVLFLFLFFVFFFFFFFVSLSSFCRMF